jgi:hypothetical protein
VEASDQSRVPAPEPHGTTPLLPAFLLRPAAALWLWALPAGVMLVLNLQGYALVEGNMDATQHGWAHVVGLAGLINLLGGLGFYGVLRWLSRTRGPGAIESRLWGLPALAVQVAYLWIATSLLDDVLPASVTRWIYPSEPFLFNQFAFAMLPLFLGVLRVAGSRPAAGVGRAVMVNLGFAIGAPLTLYLLVQSIRVFERHASLIPFIVAAAAVVLGLLMFIGIVRVLLLVLRAARPWGETGERLAIVVIALVLPVCGLLLNRNIPFPADFQAWEVYALVAANTAILLLASWKHASWPRASFHLLFLTLPFSLYFFIVFLPYTPLSILAILAVGTGFLVLTPTFLFTLHLHLLNKALRSQRSATAVGRLRLVAGGTAFFLALPAFFVVRGLADKAALNAALDHVYAPALESGSPRYTSSRLNLRRALTNHRGYKNGIYYPLLSDFYAWLVFDSLVLPDDKLARLERTFFGQAGSTANTDPVRGGLTLLGGGRGVRTRAHMPRATPPPRTVQVRALDVKTQPAGDDVTTATIMLTLENTGAAGGIGAEYVKTLPLPAGVFVSGFRLHIEGTPVPGRIFEKKTALWVYTMIRDSELRDPGLLVYTSPDEVELRVFPVVRDKPVTVEVDFLVPAAFVDVSPPPGSADPAEVLAGFARVLRPRIVRAARGTVAAGGFERLALPAVDREPYLHLIVDRSADTGFNGDFTAVLRSLRERFPTARRARITLASHDVVDLLSGLTSMDTLALPDRRTLERALPAGGGFEPDLALARALRLHRTVDLDPPRAGGEIPARPVFVILSRADEARTFDLSLSETWSDLVPQFEVYELGRDGVLITHRTAPGEGVPHLRVGASQRPLVAGRATRFGATAGAAPLEFWSPTTRRWERVSDVSEIGAESKRWVKAVSLHLAQQDHTRSPGDSAVDASRLVEASRESGVLLASTSYIVVENEAQWRMLALAEGRKLGQSAALAFLETPAPPALIVALGFALWLGLRRSRASRRHAVRPS